jgi:O-antigen/teichoic acid export membrane protein
MAEPGSKAVRQLGGQTAWFMAGNFFTLLVGFPLQIYVARKLGPNGLGIFSLVEGSMALIAGLLGFGIAQSLVKFIPGHLERGEFASVRNLLKLGFYILLCSGCVAYVLLIVMFPLIFSIWPEIAPYRSLLMVMGLLIPLSLLLYYLQQGLRGFQEIRQIVFGNSFLQLLLKAFLAVAFLSLGFGLAGYAWAIVVSMLVAGIYLAGGLWRRIRSLHLTLDTSDPDSHKNNWRQYAKVQYATSLLSLGSTYLDRFLLAMFAGMSPVGVLVIAKQLQQLPGIFHQMFLVVAAPMFSSAHVRGNSAELHKIVHLSTDWVMRLSAPLLIFLGLFAEPLLDLYGPDFARLGRVPLLILLVGQIVNLALGPTGVMLNMCGEERRLFVLSLWHTLFTVAGMLLLVPLAGLEGAALAISLGLVGFKFSAQFLARKYLDFHWWDPRYKSWMATTLVTIACGLFVRMAAPEQPSLITLCLFLALLYLVFLVVNILVGLNDDDRDFLRLLKSKVVNSVH